MSLVQQLEEMRMRMNELAKHEGGLVAALGDALRETDHQLLQDVRRLTADHDARRTLLLQELQQLASRLNGYPGLNQQVSSVNGTARGLLSAAPAVDGQHVLSSADQKRRGADIHAALNSLNGRTSD